MIGKVILGVLAVLAILILLLAGIGVCGLCMFTNKVTNQGYSYEYSGIVETREDKTTHAAADKVSIDGDTFGGDVVVSESATGNIEVVYVVHATNGRLSNIVTNTTYAMEGDTLKIRTWAKIPEYQHLMFGNIGADLYIKVPRNASYDLNLGTAGGDVVVPALEGTSLMANTAGGDINLRGVSYDSITVNTAGGKITANYGARNAVFDTMGGDITLDATQTTGTLKANTAGGDISLILPQGTLFSIDAATMGGRIKHGYVHLVTTDESGYKLNGYTEGGSGNLSVDLKTMGGDIEISY